MNGAAGSASAGAPAPPLTLPEAEEAAGLDREEDEVDLKMAVKLLLAQQLQKEKRPRKRIDGLDSEGSEGDSDEGFSKLPGARGAMAGAKLRAAMMRHPKRFSDRMETMVQALETDAITATRQPCMWPGACRCATSEPSATWSRCSAMCTPPA